MFYGTHFPKTGGTSLLAAFTEIYGLKKILSLGRAAYNFKNLSLIKLLYTNQENINDYEFISGHDNDFSILSFWDQPEKSLPTTFILNRDPLETYWSSFYQRTIEGNSGISPEEHLKNRGHSPSADWHEKKFAPLIGSGKEASWEKIFMTAKYLFFTEQITSLVPLIYPKMKQFLRSPKRVRKEITKDFQPHPLEKNNDYNKAVKEYLARDYEFINQQRMFSTKNDLPYCKAYDEEFLKESIINMRKRIPKREVALKYKERYEHFLAKQIQQSNASRKSNLKTEAFNVFKSIDLEVPKNIASVF